MIAVYVIIGVAAGFFIGFFFMKQRALTAESNVRQQLNEQRAESERQLAASFQQQLQELSAAKGEAERLRAVAETQLSEQQRHAEDMRSEILAQAETRNRLMQEEVKNMAERMLKDSRHELTTADKERLDALLTPLRQQLDTFAKAVSENSRHSEAHKTEIKTAFEEAMKKLHDEQERTVRELREQTERIGNDAASLTQALKGDSKAQGDWGEMILDKTLEDCGLIKGEQYSLQETYRDGEGNIFRPDAVVNFPNGERIVIDAKVSLTAYLEAARCDDQQRREALLREHVASVRRHVDELTVKNYDRLVEGSIGYVLMFLPYESGYAAALRTDPSVLQYAYKRKVIIISPANLLMTLQLTHTMWQNYRMNRNVEEIMRQSSDLYDKFVTFAETFLRIDRDIETLRQHFETARGQLSEGKGNVVRRLENMKQLGVSPKKSLPDDMKGGEA